MKEAKKFVTRFAPSPNGWLHLGHAYSALTAARAAQDAGGIFYYALRILMSVGRDRILSRAFIKTSTGWGWLGPNR